jgi:hypothetical protein
MVGDWWEKAPAWWGRRSGKQLWWLPLLLFRHWAAGVELAARNDTERCAMQVLAGSSQLLLWS